MNKISTHILLILLLVMLVGESVAVGQDRQIIIEKGARTFTATSNADSYEWYVDGVVQPGISIEKFTNNWKIENKLELDTFELSAIPFKEGCAGELFKVELIVKDDVTKGEIQVVFTSVSPLLACPPSNVTPLASQTIVEVELRYYSDPLDPSKYMLVDNVEYAVKYSVNNGNPVTKVLNRAQASFELDVKNLSPGNHHLKILKLAHGEGFRKQVDYTNSKNQPDIEVKVRPAPMILDIEAIEEE